MCVFMTRCKKAVHGRLTVCGMFMSGFVILMCRFSNFGKQQQQSHLIDGKDDILWPGCLQIWEKNTKHYQAESEKNIRETDYENILMFPIFLINSILTTSASVILNFHKFMLRAYVGGCETLHFTLCGITNNQTNIFYEKTDPKVFLIESS